MRSRNSRDRQYNGIKGKVAKRSSEAVTASDYLFGTLSLIPLYYLSLD
jgi:hypothetical protein